MVNSSELYMLLRSLCQKGNPQVYITRNITRHDLCCLILNKSPMVEGGGGRVVLPEPQEQGYEHRNAVLPVHATFSVFFFFFLTYSNVILNVY